MAAARGLGGRSLRLLVTCRLRPELGGRRALGLGLRAHAQRGLLGAGGLAEQPLGLDALGCEPGARAVDDAAVEAETARDLERVGGAGPAERERVGGRERLRVEADGAVERARRRARPLLDLGVVGRRDRQRGALRELVEQGARERRALDRVRARRDLVEQHEGRRRRGGEDLHEVAQMPGERRERRGDRLLVADVGEHVAEDGQSRALGRHVQAALVQQGAQSERLQGDGLAARVGAAEHEHAHAGERHVDRHDGGRVEQRVARGDELDAVGRLDRTAAPAARERARGQREVDLGERLDGAVELAGVAPDVAGELGEDARDLVALVAFELAQAVRQLDDRERLDEQRLAGVARVMDDARHGGAGARAHGDDGPAAALGDEVLLEMRLQVGIGSERAQPVAGPPARGRELGAQRFELRRGRVLDARRIQLERALEAVGDDCQRLRDLTRAGSQERYPLGPLLEVPAHAERGARGLGDRDEAVGAERSSASRVLGIRAHVVCARHPRRPLLHEHEGLGAERLACAHLAGVGRGQQRLGERAAGREGRVVRQPLLNRGELEHVERVTVHHAAG